MKAAILILCMLGGVYYSCAQSAVRSPQASKRIGIKFSCTCTDGAGAAFATAMRDLLASSPRYEEVSSAETKLANENENYMWQINVVSMDPTKGRTGEHTVISAVFLFGNSMYLSHVVQTCNRDEISSCASDTLASFDGILNTPTQ